MLRNRLLPAVFCLLLAACQGGTEDGASAVAAYSGEPPLTPGWLGERLPASALVYHRVPNPFALLSAPKGSVLSDALASDAHVRSILAIREGLADNVLDEFEVLDDPRLRALVQHLRSPVEIAVLGPDDESVSLSALIVMQLGIEDRAAFGEWFGALLADVPGAKWPGALDAGGVAEISGLPFGLAAHFEPATGRVALLAGPAVDAELLRARLSALAPATAHPMQALQRDIDQSGQGLFLWADPKNTLKLGQMFMPPDVWLAMHESGLDQVESLALGFGVANGKGRLRVAAAVPEVEFRQFLPTLSNAADLEVVGQPGVVLLLSVPSADYLRRMADTTLASMDEAERRRWQEIEETVQETLGVGLWELLDTLGPELFVVADDVGDYSAVRVRDAARFDKVMQALSARTGTPVESRRIAGQTYYRWYVPSLFELAGEQEVLDKAGPMRLFLGMGEHFYWTRDGEYLLLAQIPQPLMDRAARGADTNLADWLRDTQRQDVTASVLAVSARTRKLPRRVYYFYLEMLQELAELSGAEFDAWSLPTAGQLALPTDGALGLSVNLGDPVVSAELMFENNPLEGLLGTGGGTTIAAVGILAAVAIPAYQDYTLRAEVLRGMALAAAHKAAVADFYQENGRHMNADEINELLGDEQVADDIWLEVEPDSGVIEIVYDMPELGDDPYIVLRPQFEDGGATFVCRAEMALEYVPRTCRGDE